MKGEESWGRYESLWWECKREGTCSTKRHLKWNKDSLEITCLNPSCLHTWSAQKAVTQMPGSAQADYPLKNPQTQTEFKSSQGAAELCDFLWFKEHKEWVLRRSSCSSQWVSTADRQQTALQSHTVMVFRRATNAPFLFMQEIFGWNFTSILFWTTSCPSFVTAALMSQPWQGTKIRVALGCAGSTKPASNPALGQRESCSSPHGWTMHAVSRHGAAGCHCCPTQTLLLPDAQQVAPARKTLSSR